MISTVFHPITKKHYSHTVVINMNSVDYYKTLAFAMIFNFALGIFMKYAIFYGIRVKNIGQYNKNIIWRMKYLNSEIFFFFWRFQLGFQFIIYPSWYISENYYKLFVKVGYILKNYVFTEFFQLFVVFNNKPPLKNIRIGCILFLITLIFVNKNSSKLTKIFMKFHLVSTV